MVENVVIFCGYDSREAVAYHTCCQSIIDRSSMALEFHPVHLGLFKDYTETHTDGSNAFIYSRFLVPWLQNFKGWALWLDGDMVVLEDVAELWALRDHYKAVQVVKHPDYVTKYPIKYLGNRNESFPMKNWSSVILWNCGHFANRGLTPTYVENATGAQLHRFSWLSDDLIGELPRKWNHLCLEDEPTDAALHHYTIGLPAFNEYSTGPEAELWWSEYHKAIKPL